MHRCYCKWDDAFKYTGRGLNPALAKKGNLPDCPQQWRSACSQTIMPSIFDGSGDGTMYIWESALEASVRIPCISFLDPNGCNSAEGLVQVGESVTRNQRAEAVAASAFFPVALLFSLLFVRGLLSHHPVV